MFHISPSGHPRRCAEEGGVKVSMATDGHFATVIKVTVSRTHANPALYTEPRVGEECKLQLRGARHKPPEFKTNTF